MESLIGRWRTVAYGWALVLMATAGCEAPIGVERADPHEIYAELNSNVFTDGQPSAHTEGLLQLNGLLDSYDSDPKEALLRMHQRMEEESSREYLYALSELSYYTAEQFDSKAHYMGAAVYAYLFLFSRRDHSPLAPYDRRVRTACDLYNYGLLEALRGTSGDPQLKGGVFPLPVGSLELQDIPDESSWLIESFERFQSADDFKMRGLAVRHRYGGLGAPLIADRLRVDKAVEGGAYLSPEAQMPATLFMRLEGGLEEFRFEEARASLELHVGHSIPDLDVAGIRVPLERDDSTYLAHALEVSSSWDFELDGLFDAEEDTGTGLFMMQPYQVGKIPVVFIHGTGSSPARWAEMLNGIVWDPVVRDRYQFWYFRYTTGNPMGYSAMRMRETLKSAVSDVDPNGMDSALRRMVMIGHSQGGLMARLLASSSGEIVWNSVSDQSIDELEMADEDREVLRRAMFFEPLPFLDRVIYISTPHRGSIIAGGLVGFLFSSLISLPGEMLGVTRSLFAQGHKAESEDTPTALDQMDPENRFIKILQEIPQSPRIHVNSIIAIDGDGPVEEGDDGVVSYASAHLEQAESEFIVDSGHSCQANPLVIQEVRRILLEHVGLSTSGVLRPTRR